MRSVKTALFAIVAVVALLATTASLSAQSYEGPTAATGVFSVPSDVAGGSSVGFVIEGIIPTSSVSVTLLLPDGGVLFLDSLVANGDGDIDENIVLPNGLQPGSYTLRLAGNITEEQDFLNDVSFTIAPTSAGNVAASISSEAAADGGFDNTAVLVVTSLVPGSPITIESGRTDQGGFDSTAEDPVIVAGQVQVRADGSGAFSGETTLPGTEPGNYELRISGTLADGTPFLEVIPYVISANGSASAPVAQTDTTTTTTIPATAAATTAPAELALTGSSSLLRALNGALIVAVGLALIFVGARRRDEEATSLQD